MFRFKTFDSVDIFQTFETIYFSDVLELEVYKKGDYVVREVSCCMMMILMMMMMMMMMMMILIDDDEDEVNYVDDTDIDDNDEETR